MHLLKHHSCSPSSLSEADWLQLADSTEGYSGSDLATMTADALLQPVREMEEAHYWKPLSSELRITPTDTHPSFTILLLHPVGSHQHVPCDAADPQAMQCIISDLHPSQVSDRYPPVCLSVHPSICLSVSLFIHLQVHPRAVTLADYLVALSVSSRTVTEEELLRYEQFTASMGHHRGQH